MKTLPLSEAKARLSGLVEQVRALDDQVTITRNGRPAAVLVSAEEFERWKETIEVRGDAALMKEIRAGLRALRSRKARLFTDSNLYPYGVTVMNAFEVVVIFPTGVVALSETL